MSDDGGGQDDDDDGGEGSGGGASKAAEIYNRAESGDGDADGEDGGDEDDMPKAQRERIIKDSQQQSVPAMGKRFVRVSKYLALQHIFPNNPCAKKCASKVKEKLAENNVVVEDEDEDQHFQDPNTHEATAMLTAILSVLFAALRLPDVLGGPLQMAVLAYQFLITGVPLIQQLRKLNLVYGVFYKCCKCCCKKKKKDKKNTKAEDNSGSKSKTQAQTDKKNKKKEKNKKNNEKAAAAGPKLDAERQAMLTRMHKEEEEEGRNTGGGREDKHDEGEAGGAQAPENGHVGPRHDAVKL